MGCLLVFIVYLSGGFSGVLLTLQRYKILKISYLQFFEASKFDVSILLLINEHLTPFVSAIYGK